MVPAKLLVGPADASWAARFLPDQDHSVRCFPFEAPDWKSITEGLPKGWTPAAVLLRIGYTSIPSWVCACPAPIVALAHDPNLLWHQYREQLPFFDLVLTDRPAVERFRRAGLSNVQEANLYGLDNDWLAEVDLPEQERDIDILFVGNLNPAVQGDRLRWLGRLARLGAKWNVAIRTGVFGAEYRALVRRAKVVFNRSIRGECNMRALEAAAGGAVLLEEADNEETPHYLAPDAEFVRYSDENLKVVADTILADEAERLAIAARARERVRSCGWVALIRQALANRVAEWNAVKERAARRAANPPTIPLSVRLWQRASRAVGPDADPLLLTDLQAAGADHGLALAAKTPIEAISFLARAAPVNRVSAVGLGSALAAAGRKDEAIEALRSVLGALELNAQLTDVERATCPYPPRYDYLRVGWDRAGWDHPDDPKAEGRAKSALLQCRGQSLLAELTGELTAFTAAADAAPNLPTVRAALGCALARSGRFDEAAERLRVAVADNPFDAPAAHALIGVLTESRQTEAIEQLKRDQQLLARALGKTKKVPPTAPSDKLAPLRAPAPSDPRVIALTRDDFKRRFGTLDTSRALTGFTPAADTNAILSLVAYLKPRRLLEIGTATGQMTANLTAWTPADAVVCSLGIVAGKTSGAVEQGYEVPSRAEFGRDLDSFGTAGKAMLIAADSRSYDFTRLAPLDFAFIDGGHDFATVRSDSIKSYESLRAGGCLAWHDYGSRVAWIKVNEAIESLGFPEPLYCVEGTEVAFLFKGEGVGATAGSDLPKVRVAWDGEFTPAHSLAAVNRAVCGELAARGQDLALLKSPMRTPVSSELKLSPALAQLLGRELRADATVRHRWPPDFSPPAGHGAFVLMQPWEYGRLPRAWIDPILETVDEVWAYSRAVERAYLASGIPAERVQVVPLGVDPERFRPGVDPLPLRTQKRVKFLTVGGTIPRKGFDALLTAYRRAFTSTDDVCLVVKEFGAGTFYRGQTAESMIAAHRADPAAPEIEYLAGDLSEADLARLYAVSDVYVSAYRGEGFGLPILEAMASGLPVIVTAGGPTDEFVPPSAGWRIPARVSYFPDDRAGGLDTCGRPWWLEPDVEALTAILRAAASSEDERRRRGEVARQAALGWTWARTAAAVEDRIRALRNRTPVRFRRPVPTTPPVPPPQSITEIAAPFVVSSTTSLTIPAVPQGKPRVSLTMIVKNEEHNLAACLAPLRGLVDEMIVVDTGSTDRTRDIAKSLGAKVSEFTWIDSFSAGRNAALDRATGDWAFWMDADDRLDADNARKLKALFDSLTFENAAYVMKCLCVADSPGGTATAVDHVRLFRTDPRHRWKYRVHEQILPALRSTNIVVRWSDVAVQHVGYVDAALRKRKLARDLRLLELERSEQPGDPFTLFNLGSVYNELGDMPSAIAALEGSLAGSHPNDSIVRKLHALLSQCHRRAGDQKKAVAACRAGRDIYPDDAELLFIESNLLKESKDANGAEELLLRLIHGREGDHFGSVDMGLRGHKARHNLACLYFENSRFAEAESQWRSALVDEPGFLPAHLGLGELYLRQRNWPAVDRAATDLRRLGEVGEAEAESLVGRSLTTRGEHRLAREILEQAVARFPKSIPVRAALSYTLLEGGADFIDSEAALRDVLKLDPNNAQAKRNLEALYRNTGRWIEGVIDSPIQN